jgi:flagellar protein FlgJ
MGTSAAADTATASRQVAEIESFQNWIDAAAAVSSSSELSSEAGQARDTLKSEPSDSVLTDRRLPGDIIGSSSGVTGKHTIDRTSKLYEKSQELETFFMKILLSSMRATVNKTSLTGEENSFARGMYEDMMYDEFATAMTKNAGFGLADQVYLQLSGQR